MNNGARTTPLARPPTTLESRYATSLWAGERYGAGSRFGVPPVVILRLREEVRGIPFHVAGPGAVVSLRSGGELAGFGMASIGIYMQFGRPAVAEGERLSSRRSYARPCCP